MKKLLKLRNVFMMDGGEDEPEDNDIFSIEEETSLMIED